MRLSLRIYRTLLDKENKEKLDEELLILKTLKKNQGLYIASLHQKIDGKIHFGFFKNAIYRLVRKGKVRFINNRLYPC